MPETVLRFPVDDGPFKAFVDMYNKFQESIKKLPEDWEKVNAGIAKGSASLDHLMIGMLQQNEVLQQTLDVHERIAKVQEDEAKQRANDREAKRRADELKEQERLVSEQARYWRDMANSAGRFALSIRDATLSLIKWSGITAIVSGVLGFGGLFGISRLAGTVSQGRQGALGLGIPYGEQEAFAVNFGRYVNTGSFLGGVNESLMDVTRRQALYGAGLSEQDIAGKNTAQVGALLLQHLRDFAIQNQGPLLGPAMRARGLDQFTNLQELQRLANTPQAEFNRTMQGFQRDIPGMAATDQTLQKWQDLSTQLDRAKEKIETVLVNSLADLAPDLEKLSTSIADLVRSLLGGDAGKANIELIREGLHWLATEIGSPEFHTSVEKFALDVVALAKATAHAIEYLSGGVVPLAKATAHAIEYLSAGGVVAFAKDIAHAIEYLLGDTKEQTDARKKFPGQGGANPESGSTTGVSPLIEQMMKWLMDHHLLPGSSNGVNPTGFIIPYGPPGLTGGYGTNPMIMNAAYNTGMMSGFGGGGNFASIEAMHPNLPSGILTRLEYVESRGRDVNSSAGAEGYFQFMPGTWQRFGSGSPHNEMQAASGAANYLDYLMRLFHGDVGQSLAAYNAGEQRVQDALRQAQATGRDWRSFLPRETQNYVRQFGYGMPANGNGGGTVRLDVNNNTGGSAVVTANQLAM